MGMSTPKNPWEVCFLTKPADVEDPHAHVLTTIEGEAVRPTSEKQEAIDFGIKVMHQGVAVGRLTKAEVSYEMVGDEVVSVLRMEVRAPRITFLPALSEKKA